MRSMLCLFSIVALSPQLAAQPSVASRLRPVTSAPRHAGIYHISSGTWTRNAAMASLGADRIYVNTCPSGYFLALSGATFTDEGRVPSPTSPINLNSRPGCATSYTVAGFEVGYCIDSSNVDWTWAFYSTYAPCTPTTGLTAAATFSLSGLPDSAGAPLCWIVQIDTSGAPPTVTPFVLAADGDGTYNTPPDWFGWSMRSSLVGAAGTGTGPMLAGDPNNCDGFDGTRWDNGAPPSWPNNLLEDGTGMGTADQFRIDGGPMLPGCYWSDGPHPFWSFHLVLFSDACPSPEPGTSFCCGTCGSPSTCPCANCSRGGTGSCVGCLNSLGMGARLTGTGTASLAADQVRLLGSQMPNASALYFQGTMQQGGGLGTPFGDGLHCASGVATRLGIETNVAGSSHYPDVGEPPISVRGLISMPGTRTYQVWYRNPAPFCTPQGFNLSNGYQIVWGP